MLLFLEFITILLLSETLTANDQATPYTGEDGRFIYTTGDVLHRNLFTYTIRKELGKGAFATVVEAVEDETGIPRAIKIINNNSAGKKSAKDEESILNAIAKLNSKHLSIKLELFEDYKHTCIVFEKHGLSLIDVMEKFEIESLQLDHARNILDQLSDDVQLLHDNKIAHRDISTANVLLDHLEYKPKSNDAKYPGVKLIDFGNAKFLNESTDPESEKKLDVQKIGVVTLELLYFFSNFNHSEKDKKKYEADLDDNLIEITADGVEYIKVHDLLEKMLKYDPHERISLTQVRQHPFITGLPLQQPNKMDDAKRKKRSESPQHPAHDSKKSKV